MAKICESSLSDFNSQPREGGWGYRNTGIKGASNFNSQPREGGWERTATRLRLCSHFNSQPREGGWSGQRLTCNAAQAFQLTAARRRLACAILSAHRAQDFNSQPREGGWLPA